MTIYYSMNPVRHNETHGRPIFMKLATNIENKQIGLWIVITFNSKTPIRLEWRIASSILEEEGWKAEAQGEGSRLNSPLVRDGTRKFRNSCLDIAFSAPCVRSSRRIIHQRFNFVCMESGVILLTVDSDFNPVANAHLRRPFRWRYA